MLRTTSSSLRLGSPDRGGKMSSFFISSSRKSISNVYTCSIRRARSKAQDHLVYELGGPGHGNEPTSVQRLSLCRSVARPKSARCRLPYRLPKTFWLLLFLVKPEKETIQEAWCFLRPRSEIPILLAFQQNEPSHINLQGIKQ